MRRRMIAGDFVFGISPSSLSPRRIIFAAQIEERLTFGEAHGRFPDLQGPAGPIHIRPVDRPFGFPESSYEHIPGSMHAEEWKKDLASSDLDAFFVCSPRNVWLGRWLGADGPAVDDAILEFLRTCTVHGKAGRLRDRNDLATIDKPIAHRRLYTGLHLETDEPANLLALVGPHASATSSPSPISVTASAPSPSAGCMSKARRRAREPIAPRPGRRRC